MATLPTYFRGFLSAIEPTKKQKEDKQTGQKTLRKRLDDDEDLAPILVSHFLQGSYRRSTAIRPAGESKSDVDVIVVTNLDPDHVTAQDALGQFLSFVKKHYKGNYRQQGRSIGITLSYVELDLVVTAAPSLSEETLKALKSAAVRSDATPESDLDWRLNEHWLPQDQREHLGARYSLLKAAEAPQWKTEPLWIPNRELDRWERTHPLAQIEWTFEKSRATNGNYVKVVKALKWWWRKCNNGDVVPKGYPLEHIIGDRCPDGIDSVAEGVTLVLEGIRDHYQCCVDRGEVPRSNDRGVEENVLERLTVEEFAHFHAQATEDAELAREALEAKTTPDSAKLWRDLFGSKFPEPPSGKDDSGSGSASMTGGFSQRDDLSVPPPGDFS